MRRSKQFSIVALGIILLLSFSLSFAGDQPECNWCAFSNSLVKALKSDNEGVKLSAMRMVIRHGDKLDVDEARYEVMDTFMKHKNQKVRQLALVTLYSINNELDMGFLERQLKFEEDKVIKKHIAAILNEAGRLPSNYYIEKTEVASN